jgi:hypothetical protein
MEFIFCGSIIHNDELVIPYAISFFYSLFLNKLRHSQKPKCVNDVIIYLNYVTSKMILTGTFGYI